MCQFLLSLQISTGTSASTHQVRESHQGLCSVSNYSIDYQILETSSSWKEEAQYDVFLHGLSKEAKNELLTQDLPDCLEEPVAFGIYVDDQLNKKHLLRVSAVDATYEENPAWAHAVESNTPLLQKRQPLHGKPGLSLLQEFRALRRQRRASSMQDWQEWGIPTAPLDTPLVANAVNGERLASVTSITSPLSIFIAGEYREKIQFYLLDSPLRWARDAPGLLSQSPLGVMDALGSGLEPLLSFKCPRHLPVPKSKSSKPSEPSELLKLPKSSESPEPSHRSLEQIGSRAVWMPSLWDPNPSKSLGMNTGRLWSGCYTRGPSGRTLWLPGWLVSFTTWMSFWWSMPEDARVLDIQGTAVVANLNWDGGNEQIHQRVAFLTSGIHPSPSPARASCLFVGKMDGSLHPCIDCQALNNITIKNRYPLSLMASALEMLQAATIFTKLDLRNAIYLVHICEGGVQDSL